MSLPAIYAALSELNRPLLKSACQSAIDVQNACNLSGVVRSFSDDMIKVWAISHELNLGTDFVNRHPVSILYTSKILSLCMPGSMLLHDDTCDAIIECQDIIDALNDEATLQAENERLRARIALLEKNPGSFVS